MNIIDLLANDGYVVYNKTVANEWGIYEAILLGELCAEYNYWKNGDGLEDGWFYSTIQNIEKETALTEYQQRQTIKHLEEVGVIECKQKGIPCKRFFKINVEALQNKFFSILRTVPEKTEEQYPKKLKGNNNNKNNNKNNNIFTPPTVEDVRAYCLERNNNVDAEMFVDFYASKGWMVGKNKMKDWKACVRTWERNHSSGGKSFSIYDL